MNYRYFRSHLAPETKMLVLVKANAYGHGAVEFASMMEEAGADYLAVAYPVEGVELRKAGISSMRIYVSADNIWTLTDYSGPDPEVSTRNSVLTPGFDWSAYPRAYGFTAGVNITF